jgi:hypothetical protein
METRGNHSPGQGFPDGVSGTSKDCGTRSGKLQGEGDIGRNLCCDGGEGSRFPDRRQSGGVDGQTLTTTGQLTGYQGTNYYALNLGQVGSGGWTAAPAGPFVTGQDPFYFKTGTLAYTGTNIAGDWLFLVADIGNNGPPFTNSGGGHDLISPKTTSAVPEPGTVILLGSGLLGLVLYRRKFKA